MALIKCPECGKKVSDKAIACPNCGYPMNSCKKGNIFKSSIEALSFCYDFLGIAPEYLEINNPIEMIDKVPPRFKGKIIGSSSWKIRSDEEVLLALQKMKEENEALRKKNPITNITFCRNSTIECNSSNLFFIKTLPIGCINLSSYNVTYYDKNSSAAQTAALYDLAKKTTSPPVPKAKKSIANSAIIGGAIGGSTGALIGALNALEYNQTIDRQESNYNKTIDRYNKKIQDLNSKAMAQRTININAYETPFLLGIKTSVGVIPFVIKKYVKDGLYGPTIKKDYYNIKPYVMKRGKSKGNIDFNEEVLKENCEASFK